ncbi:hypothetical protein Poli38472_007924 [Pythium oligandrum]|uniref:GST N-terminal domain-containing protein n=1 Tax=Pythium oligandrum TaxID=41045 RepID=A0A8K1FMX1_PYTOL|nr:hypothetical protein Poli38472_007924 [Pythium oligandrum]|eukprot:TMW65282.1 hypothetical protein Poli38472_007924 [Pythium oligandrum]
MLDVELPTDVSPSFGGGKTLTQRTKADGDVPVVLKADFTDPVKLVEEETVVETHQVTAETNFARDAEEEDDEDKYVRWETEDDESDEGDSDYREDEDDSEGDDMDDDEEEYRRSLEMELDDDEVSDFYLNRMLEERDRMEGEDAEWVEKYIQAQREWKEKYGTSIDEIDLDLRLAGLKPKKKKKKVVRKKRAKANGAPYLQVIQEAWNGRVMPLLPPRFHDLAGERMASLVIALLFVLLALGIQFPSFIMSAFPQIKLKYFNVSARAESIRLAFYIGNVPFEDIRLNREEFAVLKETLPYGQLEAVQFFFFNCMRVFLVSIAPVPMA